MSVDVNGEESRITLIEVNNQCQQQQQQQLWPSVQSRTKIQIQTQIQVFKVEEGEELSSTEELNPDCYVVVYAVDDEQSFGGFFFFLWCVYCLYDVCVVSVILDFSSFFFVA